MKVRAIGTSVPAHKIAQSDSAIIARSFANVPESRYKLFDEMYRRTGVSSRYSVILESSEGPLETRQAFYGESSPSTEDRMRVYQKFADELALESARNAISDSGIKSDEITHLISVSCTGFHSPGFDITLVKQLPLRSTIARTQIGFMGCQGSMNALRVAHGFIQSDPAACVLICSTELCSLHQFYGWDPEKIVANALFADGSASVVLTGGSHADTTPCLQMVGSGSMIIDDSTDAMSWKIANHGFEMTLSPRVPDLISSTLSPWLESWLANYGESIDSIATWAVHPGGPRILSAFCDSF
jgi:prepilin-type processing-associated H-X9-DG protein